MLIVRRTSHRPPRTLHNRRGPPLARLCPRIGWQNLPTPLAFLRPSPQLTRPTPSRSARSRLRYPLHPRLPRFLTRSDDPQRHLLHPLSSNTRPARPRQSSCSMSYRPITSPTMLTTQKFRLHPIPRQDTIHNSVAAYLFPSIPPCKPNWVRLRANIPSPALWA